MDWLTLLTGMAIFCARVVDVSIGTIRTIAIVQGRTATAFILGFFEVSMWLMVISTVVGQIKEKPILIIFYALGFSTGNVVGILVEKKMAIGNVILRFLTRQDADLMANNLRDLDQPVTIFSGRGRDGPVSELTLVTERRRVAELIRAAQQVDPDVFYITETPGQVRRLRQQITHTPTGWRAIFKRK